MGNSNSSQQKAQPPEPDDGPSTSGSNCPVAPDSRGPIYNVYNQRIDTGEPYHTSSMSAEETCDIYLASHLACLPPWPFLSCEYSWEYEQNLWMQMGAFRAEPAASPWAEEGHLNPATALQHPERRHRHHLGVSLAADVLQW